MKILACSLSLSMALLLGGCGGNEAAAPPNPVARCVACHAFEKDGAKRTGPNLHGILGQAAGNRPGFSSSSAMKESGIVWTPQTLDAFIAAPGDVVPGNRMSFPGESDAAKRKAILAYLEGIGAK
jgi:cytochrome c2